MRRLLMAALLLSPVLHACACHTTEANEVGVVARKFAVFGTRGIQPEVYEPGATEFFFPPFSTDWYVFETKLQNLRMASAEKGDLEFKTVDGNDISVDVTVAWRIDKTKVPHLLRFVGSDTSEIRDRLVRPAGRALVRDALNRLRSEDFYVADRRFAAATEAQKLLEAALGPEGVIVEQVILQEHRFHKEYEKVIREKKFAEQNGEKLKSEAQAGAEEAKRNLEGARGQVSQKIAAANGELEKAKLAADAELYRANNEAEALLTEARAKAKGIEKESAALGGAGGRTMVKLRIAEALAGKRLVFVPSGKGGQLQTTNLNELLSRYSAARAIDAAAAAPAPTP